MLGKELTLDEKLGRISGAALYLCRATQTPEDRATLILQLYAFHLKVDSRIGPEMTLKPGPYTPEEQASLKNHISLVRRVLGGSELGDSFLFHHEWWDGTGYPLAIKGNEIPIESRILAVISAYCMHECSREATREILRLGSGRRYDPHISNLMLDYLQ